MTDEANLEDSEKTNIPLSFPSDRSQQVDFTIEHDNIQNFSNLQCHSAKRDLSPQLNVSVSFESEKIEIPAQVVNEEKEGIARDSDHGSGENSSGGCVTESLDNVGGLTTRTEESSDDNITVPIKNDTDYKRPEPKLTGKQSDAAQNETQDIKEGSTFTSIFSLFQLIKTDGVSNDSLSCCPFGTPNTTDKAAHIFRNELNNPTVKTVVSTSPTPQNKDSSQFPSTLRNSLSSEGEPLVEGTDDRTSTVISEQVPPSSSISSQELNCDMWCNDNTGSNKGIMSNVEKSTNVNSAKFKLISEGDISLCFVNHSKTIISKVLTSKFLRRWETHHIYLQDDVLCSKTPSGKLESPIAYSNMEEIYGIGRGEHANQLCIRLAFNEGSIMLQASNPFVRDQWLSSILWKKKIHKSRSILNSSSRSEIILKEIKNLIHLTLDSPVQDDDVINVPIEVISNVLMEKDIWMDRERREEVILALVPLLEKATPSQEMFQFFSEHCLLHPRSRIIVDIFTSVVQRILKRTFDFGKSPNMRKFAADYMTALHSQNDGDEAIVKFLVSVHGPTSECPHPRVLQNLVAVNLAAILSYFEQKRILLTESGNEENCSQALQQLDRQLQCQIIVFRAISEFRDWRPGLAQLLQPIPFPDDALSNEFFVEGFTPVIKCIGTDTRCEVHEMILGIREGKGGWLDVYCPSGLVCNDDGELWCQMLETLISCCCKRKSFLQKMMKHLGALILVALRGHDVAQMILCLMLEWRMIKGEDQELQVVTALESTGNGREKYGELCKRQEHLRQLQKKKGPRKLTLPSRSTDVDVAQLLSSGSFGNLECLSLAFTHVTSSCAYQLIQLPTLRCLNLWATHFGDAGLVIIAEHLDKLQVLNLCETPVTDKGISALAGMKNLKKLNLNSTKLSPETLETLKQKLPALQELDVRYTDAW